jgi:hypothetical protein
VLCGQTGQLSAYRKPGGSFEPVENPSDGCKVLSQLWEHVYLRDSIHISRLSGDNGKGVEMPASPDGRGVSKPVGKGLYPKVPTNFFIFG